MLKADHGVSPADVLLGSMRLYWVEAQDEKLDASDRSRAMDKAAEIAIHAAPYFHAELVATETEHPGKDGELIRAFRGGERLKTKRGDSDETIPRVGPGEKLH